MLKIINEESKNKKKQKKKRERDREVWNRILKIRMILIGYMLRLKNLLKNTPEITMER